MPYFRSPKIIFGQGALKRLVHEIKGKGARAAVITDKNMVTSAERLVQALTDAGYEVTVWDGALGDPPVEVAVEAGRALLDFNPQWVVGFGGGSAMDTAKAAWVLYEMPELDTTQLNRAVTPKAALILRQKAGFIAVPTTSGTGADVTWVAVLTDTAKRQKIVLAHNDLVPDMAVLEPELTLDLPKDLTASIGLDVLAHAVDGFTARQRTDFSDGLCLQAVKLTFEWLPRAVQDGSDLTAREKMQNAATIAGLGFGNSNTGLSHALAQSVGALLHVPHGRGVGIALPHSLDYIASNPPLPEAPDPVERLCTIARFLGITSGSDSEVAKALIVKIRELSAEIGEPHALQDVGIAREQMDEEMDTLVRLAGKDPNMYTTPCACGEEQLQALFWNMWGGKGKT
jgi:alcohol dehydrogenase class IV